MICLFYILLSLVRRGWCIALSSIIILHAFEAAVVLTGLMNVVKLIDISWRVIIHIQVIIQTMLISHQILWWNSLHHSVCSYLHILKLLLQYDLLLMKHLLFYHLFFQQFIFFFLVLNLLNCILEEIYILILVLLLVRWIYKLGAISWA